ncbi:hypothetical protein BsWGS_21926 [Bradybaena similaris]
MSDTYENTTETELESLEAIYINELTYSRTSDGQVEKIELLVHPATGHDVTKQYVCMTLVFTISSKYPNEPPEIVIRNPRGLGEEEVTSLVADMLLKAEEMKGEPMLYTLIEMAKDSITEGNIPHCPCVVCLEHFLQRDSFHRTACYHYFHSRCLYKYLLHAQAQLEVEEKEASERRHLEVGGSDKDKSGKIICPVCRSPLDEESLAVTCSRKELEEDEKAEEFVIPEDLKEQQRKMLEMYEQQKAKGGIIDLEHEKNKYLVNAEDRMPVRSQKPPMTIINDVTKSATSKQGAGERHRDRPNSSGRQDGSSQQYRKGRGRGRGHFHSGRSHQEWSGYEGRPGVRLKTEDGADRRTNYPPGFGPRRTKDMTEKDFRTQESSEQRKTSEERSESGNTKRIREKERRVEGNDARMRVGHDDGSLNAVHRMDGGFVRTDRTEKLDERYDNQRTDDRQKVDRRKDNTDRHERRDDDRFKDDSEIADRESTQIETGRVTEADSKYRRGDNGKESYFDRTYSPGSDHRREEVGQGRKTNTGESYRIHQKHYSNLREKENNNDESNSTEKTKDIIREELPVRQAETDIVTGEVQPAKNMHKSEKKSSKSGTDRFYKAKSSSGVGRRGEMYKNRTERASVTLSNDDVVLGNDVSGASGVDRPSNGGRNDYFKDQDDEHSGYSRKEEQRIIRGYDKGSSGYQRDSGNYWGRGPGTGQKHRGSKFQEGRGSYAGYSERSHVRNDRSQQQQHQHQQQQWHHHNRHGEERERAERNVTVDKERKAEDDVNSTTGQGACGTDITSEAGSKDDDEADLYCQFVPPYRQASTCVFSGDVPKENKLTKLTSVESQDLLDNASMEDGTKAGYGLKQFYYDKHSHKNSGSEMIDYDNTDDDNAKIKMQKTYPAYSEAELRKFCVGYDEVDEENWDEEMDIYYYERYKIRPQNLEDYNKLAAPRKKYYEDKLKEKHDQQNMVEKEQRRIIKERLTRGFIDDDGMESPVKTESKKDVHMKSILDEYKEEKTKELGTSVTLCENNHRKTETIPTNLLESAVTFQSKVDRLYKSTLQNTGSCYRSQDSIGCEWQAHEKRHAHTSNQQDTAIWQEKQENSTHLSSERLNRRRIVNTKCEDTKSETFNKSEQGMYSERVGNDKDVNIITSLPHLRDNSFLSDVVCSSKCYSGKVADSKGVSYRINGVSRRSDYRDSNFVRRNDNTDIGVGDVSHIGGCRNIGDSHISDHRAGGDPYLGNHKCDGISDIDNDVSRWSDYRDSNFVHRNDSTDIGAGDVSHRGDSRDIGDVDISDHRAGGDPYRGSHKCDGMSYRCEVPFRVESRDKGVPLTTGDRDIDVSQIMDHRNVCLPSRYNHRNDGVSGTEIKKDSYVSFRGKGVSLTSIGSDSCVSHSSGHTDTDIHMGGPPYKIKSTNVPASFIKNFKKAPPLKFPKKNKQGPISDSSQQAAVAETARDGGAAVFAMNACHQRLEQASENNCSKSVMDNHIVTDSQLILSQTTSAMLNAGSPVSVANLLNSCLTSSVLSDSLLGSNLIMDAGLNSYLQSLYGTYSGNFSNECLSDLYALKKISAQNVTLGNSVTVNTCGVSGGSAVNCMAGDAGSSGKREAGGLAFGKENINNSPVVTK